jgi:hypothetical protein
MWQLAKALNQREESIMANFQALKDAVTFLAERVQVQNEELRQLRDQVQQSQVDQAEVDQLADQVNGLSDSLTQQGLDGGQQTAGQGGGQTGPAPSPPMPSAAPRGSQAAPRGQNQQTGAGQAGGGQAGGVPRQVGGRPIGGF